MSARSLIKCPVSLGGKALSLLVVTPLLVALCASAEGPRAEQNETAPGQTLEWMAARAPVIFFGEVLSDEVSSAGISAAPVSVVQIRVAQAVRGVSDGQVFNLGSWAGADRLMLAPHERVVLFLRQPNAAGITSSALGGFGVLRIGGGDLVDAQALSLLARELGFGVDGQASRAEGASCPAVPLLQPHLGSPGLGVSKASDPCTMENTVGGTGRIPLRKLIAMLHAITQAQLPEDVDAR